MRVGKQKGGRPSNKSTDHGTVYHQQDCTPAGDQTRGGKGPNQEKEDLRLPQGTRRPSLQLQDGQTAPKRAAAPPFDMSQTDLGLQLPGDLDQNHYPGDQQQYHHQERREPAQEQGDPDRGAGGGKTAPERKGAETTERE